MRLTGKVVYNKLEGGFWGIIAPSGKKYRPVQMPDQLKHEGRQITVQIRRRPDLVDVFMWGETVEIVGFHTVG